MQDVLPDVARILLVDDDPVLLHVLTQTISHRLERVVVESVSSPYSALDQVRRGQYDLVLSDVKMPRMNGLTLLREIKRITPRTLVILMTGYGDGDPTLASEGEKLGAADLLHKPLDRDKLTATLKHLLKRT